jgi:hypothetical protein
MKERIKFVPTFEVPFQHREPRKVWAALLEMPKGAYWEDDLLTTLKADGVLNRYLNPKNSFHGILMHLAGMGFIHGFGTAEN